MSSQKYPEVKFKPASFEHVINLINDFLNPKKEDWDWSNYILSRYPILNEKLKDVKKISERKRITCDFFKQFILKNKRIMEKKASSFQKEWGKINDEYMKTLGLVLEIDWSRKDKKITALVSPNPICPRYIRERIFDIYLLSSVDYMKATVMHEILHFLYFEKWKKIFPKTSEKEFDSPYLTWKLSEMVPAIILLDKRIQKIFLHKPEVYQEYQKLKIKGKPLLDYLQEFYSNRKDFEDFLRKSWAFVKKHEKEVNRA
jgi:hypothetical protein